MTKQIKKLMSLLGISIGLVSISYFNQLAFGINLGVVSEINPENKNFISELQQAVNNYSSISSFALNVDLNNQTQNDNLASLKTDLPEIFSAKGVDYLIGTTQKTSETNKYFQGMETTNFGNNQQDIYNFEVSINKKEYDLNSSLNSILNDQSTNNSNLADNLKKETTNSNSYATLQEEFVASVQVQQVPGEYVYSQPVVNELSSVANPPTSRHNWFQYFAKGQQYSNSTGLIDDSSDPYITKQLRLQQQVEREIQQKMPFTKTPTQKYFQIPRR
jgi:predicted unusual protein kinase regulating ubiquinone biosynthesis (AarF/ABC1/UbiB family)